MREDGGCGLWEWFFLRLEIRRWMSKALSPSVAESIRIIYGGSVKGSNAKVSMPLSTLSLFLRLLVSFP